MNAIPQAIPSAPSSAIERARIELDGTDSIDSDGQIVAYGWSQISGPTAEIANPGSGIADLSVPEVDRAETARFRLTVTDDDGAEDVADVDIEFRPDPVDEAEVISFEHDGKTRAYTLYRPETFRAGNAAWLLLHGGSQSMRRVLDIETSTRRWVELAEAHGAALIVPNGFSESADSGLTDMQSWNDIRDDASGRTSREDDTGFLLRVLDDARSRTDHDPGKVIVGGSSNGGIMAMTLLIRAPERFAGGAAFIASLPQETVPDPARAVPVFLLNGTDDPLIRFGGGEVGNGGAPTRPVLETVDYWLRVTGSDTATRRDEVLPDPADDGCALSRSRWSAVAGGPDMVTYVEAVGGGHAIPDPTPPDYSPSVLAAIGNVCEDVHGVDLAIEALLGDPDG